MPTTITITITKRRVAAALLAAAVAVPSIAAAGQRFGDVSSGHTFHDNIEWIADQNITLGCGDGGSYCPNEPVTRGQMAAFLHRMSGEADGFGRSVNAEKLDGYHAAQLTRVAREIAPDVVPHWSGDRIPLTRQITAPADGYLIIRFTSNLGRDASETGSGDALVRADLFVDGDAVDRFPSVGFDFDTPNNASQRKSMVFDHVADVAAGVHTVKVDLVGSLLGGQSLRIEDRSLIIEFVPFAEPDGPPVVAFSE